MHVAALLLSAIAACALAYLAFQRCARNQRAHFVDRPDPRRGIVYQALPTTTRV